MIVTAVRLLWPAQSLVLFSGSNWDGSPPPPAALLSKSSSSVESSRRQILRQAVLVVTAAASGVCGTLPLAATAAEIADPIRSLPPRLEITATGTVQIILSQPTRLGLELMDVTIGTPPRTVAAVRAMPFATRVTGAVQAGMILPDFDSAAAVSQRLANGPYPVTLVFANLASMTGDAIGDDEMPLVTAQDALNLAQQTSGGSSGTADSTTGSTKADAYTVAELSFADNSCTTRSRRGDVLEIEYEARWISSSSSSPLDAAKNGFVYDSSQQRGTGSSYFMVLGSGDMLPGVDLGLYDMCPGQVRGLTIPPRLAYSSKGNRTWRIPPNATLYWNVRLVSVNAVPR
jgi:FKBP-type peptidyl-prolyl cis-trans isomerase